MKLKLAVRVLNEEYHLGTFIAHYLDAGADEIVFLDSGSTDATLQIIDQFRTRGGHVRLAMSDESLRCTSYSIEEKMCNMGLAEARADFERTREETWWIFPDADEYVRQPVEGLRSWLASRTGDVVRGVFLDWFLDPQEREDRIGAEAMLRKARNGDLKGRILETIGDPFYKDLVLRYSAVTTPRFRNLSVVMGNHRLVLDGALWIPEKADFLVFDHLRGIPRVILDRRITMRLELLRANYERRSDALTYEHFSRIKKEIDSYPELYGTLKDMPGIAADLQKAAAFDSTTSKFNRMFAMRFPPGAPGR